MKRKFAGAVILVFGLGSLFLIWRVWLTLDVNSRLAAVRANGLPVNGEEVNRWYAVVPDKDNAALVLTQAFALHRNYSDSRSNLTWDFKLPRRGQSLSSEQTELLRGYVEMNAAALAKTSEALKLPACRYPMDCSLLAQTPLPHLANLRTLSVLNQYKGELAIQRGDEEAASEAVEAILGLTRSLDNEPCLISQLVRIKLLRLAVETLVRRVNAGPLSAVEASDLVAAFGRVTTTNVVARGLVGDRAMFAPYFRMTRKEAARLARPPREGEDADRDSPLPCKGPFVLRMAGFYELDFRYFLTAMETNIAVASLPPPENLSAVGRFVRAGELAGKRYRIMSGIILTSLSHAVRRQVEGVAWHRLATTALAIEQFRNKHSRLPEELAELTPSLLFEVPEDPFTGAELEYRRTENGYLIYSVGPDRKDDGGLEESEKKQSSDRKSYDLTFIVER